MALTISRELASYMQSEGIGDEAQRKHIALSAQYAALEAQSSAQTVAMSMGQETMLAQRDNLEQTKISNAETKTVQAENYALKEENRELKRSITGLDAEVECLKQKLEESDTCNKKLKRDLDYKTAVLHNPNKGSSGEKRKSVFDESDDSAAKDEKIMEWYRTIPTKKLAKIDPAKYQEMACYIQKKPHIEIASELRQKGFVDKEDSVELHQNMKLMVEEKYGCV